MRVLRLRPYALGADVIVVEAWVISRMITTSRPLDPRSQSEVGEPAAVEETGHAAPGSHLVASLPHLGLLVLEEAREVLAAEKAKARGKAKGRVREATSRPAVPTAR